jgi:hypothetical protein
MPVPSSAGQNLDIDLGQQDTGEAGQGSVTGGLARGNSAPYDTDAICDAPGFDQRDAARTVEHTVERAQTLKFHVERLELGKSFSRVPDQDCGDRFDSLSLELVERRDRHPQTLVRVAKRDFGRSADDVDPAKNPVGEADRARVAGRLFGGDETKSDLSRVFYQAK